MGPRPTSRASFRLGHAPQPRGASRFPQPPPSARARRQHAPLLCALAPSAHAHEAGPCHAVPPRRERSLRRMRSQGRSTYSRRAPSKCARFASELSATAQASLQEYPPLSPRVGCRLPHAGLRGAVPGPVCRLQTQPPPWHERSSGAGRAGAGPCRRGGPLLAEARRGMRWTPGDGCERPNGARYASRRAACQWPSGPWRVRR